MLTPTMPESNAVRLLYLTRESHPSQRPDLAVLFGRELPRHGVTSDLVALGDPQAPWPGGACHVLPAHGRLGKLRAQWRLLRQLPALAAGPVDAVQARDRFLGAWFALRAARRAGKPFFYWMSLPFPQAWLDIARSPDPTRRGLPALANRLRWGLRGAFAHWLLYRHVLPQADHVFAQSEAMADALVALGVGRDRITPVPMGIDGDEMAAVAMNSGDARLAGRRYVVYLGALERARQPELLIRAFAKLRDSERDLLLVLVGDSQVEADRHWLRQEIAENDLVERVLVTGWLPPQQARAYVRGAAVALASFPRGPVHDQASPTKLAEYLALGVPVVANDQPDQAWLLRQAGGGVSVPLTPEGLAQGLRTVLDEPAHWAAAAAAVCATVVRLRGYQALGAMVAGRYRACMQPPCGLAAATGRIVE